MIKKLFTFLFGDTCPSCGSDDYVRLGGQWYRCRKCGREWNWDEYNL